MSLFCCTKVLINLQLISHEQPITSCLKAQFLHLSPAFPLTFVLYPLINNIEKRNFQFYSVLKLLNRAQRLTSKKDIKMQRYVHRVINVAGTRGETYKQDYSGGFFGKLSDKKQQHTSKEKVQGGSENRLARRGRGQQNLFTFACKLQHQH